MQGDETGTTEEDERRVHEEKEQVTRGYGRIVATARAVKRDNGYAESLQTEDVAHEICIRLYRLVDDEQWPEGVRVGSRRFYAYVAVMAKRIIADSFRAPRNRDRLRGEEFPDPADYGATEDALVNQLDGEQVQARCERAIQDFADGRSPLAWRYSKERREQMVTAFRLNTESGFSADAILASGRLPPDVSRTTINNWVRFMRDKVIASAVDALNQSYSKVR